MKKICSLLLALVMLLTVFAVAMADVPSKTLPGGGEPVKPTGNTNATDTGAGWAVLIAKPEERLDWVNAELDKVAEFMMAGNQADTYFAENVLADCENTEAMVCTEMEAIYASGYKPEYGDSLVKFTFPTVYPEGQNVVMVLGTKGDEEGVVNYKAFVGVADAEGKIDVEMDAATLDSIEGVSNQVIMLLLAEPAA